MVVYDTDTILPHDTESSQPVFLIEPAFSHGAVIPTNNGTGNCWKHISNIFLGNQRLHSNGC